MTNKEKSLLRMLAKESKDFEEYKKEAEDYLDCSYSTIRKYWRIFRKE